MIASTTPSQQHTLLCDRESLHEWKVTMRTSNTRARKFSSTVAKIVMALVVASMIGGISIAPVFGKDHDKRQGYYERGHDRGRYDRGWREPPRRYYPEPVYAPPPVYYNPAPYQSPGINLIFPVHIR